ncbi:hypothetical protein [Bdellovibrio sp. HCB209]|uniref:hypothetical protein n=1 Tax=Bdellovibrio sp. HCB209 TaxID=3394354 RepID=UPI0039B4F926
MDKLLLTLILLAASSNTHAQVPVELISNYQTKVPNCKFVGKYLIRVANNEGMYEVDFHTSRKQDISPASCHDNKYEKALYKLKTRGIPYLDLSTDLAMTVSSWKTTETQLNIYDINQKKEIFEKKAFAHEFKSNSTIYLWIEDEKKICTEEEKAVAKGTGNETFNLRKYILNTKTLKIQKTDTLKCEAIMSIMS